MRSTAAWMDFLDAFVVLPFNERPSFPFWASPPEFREESLRSPIRGGVPAGRGNPLRVQFLPDWGLFFLGGRALPQGGTEMRSFSPLRCTL